MNGSACKSVAVYSEHMEEQASVTSAVNVASRWEDGFIPFKSVLCRKLADCNPAGKYLKSLAIIM
jgi:hypothetical protein